MAVYGGNGALEVSPREREFYERGGDRFTRETGGERVDHEGGTSAMSTPAPSNGTPAPTAPTPVDPWQRIADVIGSIQAPAIPLPQPGESTVSYVETPSSQILPILLILAAAGGAYYWYTQRKK